MRLAALALALVLVACSADPALPPRDCTPGQTSACACLGGATGVQTCTPAGTLGACVCPDAGGTADVVDAGAVPADRPATPDVPADTALPPPVDAGPSGDVVQTNDAGCPAGQVVCEPLQPRCVDLQRGEMRPAGYQHCGACGRGCSAPLRCINGACGS